MSTTPKPCAHVCTPNRPPGCPSRTSVKETNTALLELLGLADLDHIASVDIAMRPNDLPRITVQQHCWELKTIATRFHLIAELEPLPAKQQRLDLDVQCAEARMVVQNFIDQRVLLARLGIAKHSVDYDNEVRSC